MKTKKEKIEENEIPHRFIHVPNLEYKGKKYHCKDDKLYYKSRLIAKIIDRTKKKIIIGNYYTGRVYNTKSINYAIPSDWKFLHINSLDITTTLEDVIEEYVDTVIEINCEKYANKLLVLNGTFKTNHYSVTHFADIRNTLAVLKLFGVTTKQIKECANRKPDINRISAHIYIGWGSREWRYVNIPPTKPSVFLKEVELNEHDRKLYNAKLWIFNTLHGTHFARGLSAKEKLEIALDPVKKEEVVNKIRVAHEAALERTRIETERLNAEFKERFKDVLVDWRNNKISSLTIKRDNVRNVHNRPCTNYWSPSTTHLRIKDGRVETSKYVVVTLDEAKRVFKLFIKAIAKMSVGDKLEVKNEKTGVYTVNSITCGSTTDTSVIVIGCHRITMTEALDFINFYKLDWL